MFMKNKLDEIMAFKRQEVRRLESLASALRKEALKRDGFRCFRESLKRDQGVGLIAEVKKASPSAGVIAEGVDPLHQARSYHHGGAHAVSVLTDEHYFRGHLDDLKSVCPEVPLPVIRKDFIVHRNQIYESIVAGADAILLIVAGLSDGELNDLYHEAEDFGLDILVETHDLREMDRALDLGANMIGVNNRNLQTFNVSLETSIALAEEAPPDVVLVSESGIKTREDVSRLEEAGVDAILVGETLMRSQHIKATIAELLGQ